MAKFILTNDVVLNFSTKNEGALINVGYNDFEKIKPIKHLWVDNKVTLHFIISGSGYLFLDGKKYTLKKGNLFLIPANAERMYFPNEDDPWEYIWFGFRGDRYDSIAQALNLSVKHAVLPNTHFEKLLPIYSELANQIQSENEKEYFALSCFYKVLHILTTREYGGIEDAKNIIDENFSQTDFSIENLCKTTSVSHAKLCRNFKEKYHCTPMEYLTKKRMEYSEMLLKKTGLSVSSVAFSCGYSDPLNFMKKFKAIHGCTCIEYRNLK